MRGNVGSLKRVNNKAKLATYKINVEFKKYLHGVSDEGLDSYLNLGHERMVLMKS